MSKYLVGLAIAGTSFGGGVLVNKNVSENNIDNVSRQITYESNDKKLDKLTQALKSVNFRIDLYTNNLANMDTTAYKRQRYNKGKISRNFNEGAIMKTGRPLDMAILNGPGLFKVKLFDGSSAYTRDGSFLINAYNQIIDSNGNLMDPEISIPSESTRLYVSANGIVSAVLIGHKDRTDLGQISVFTFNNLDGLDSIGDNLFKKTIYSGAPIEGRPGENHFGQIVQSALEQSNVFPETEYVDLSRAIDEKELIKGSIEQLLGKKIFPNSTGPITIPR